MEQYVAPSLDAGADRAAPWFEALDRARGVDGAQPSAESTIAALTAAMDALVVRLVDDALREYARKYARPDEAYAVCAVGGYGRRELYPYSDIDLLFLYPFKPTPLLESLVEGVTYGLWDLRMTVGHAIRNVRECVDIGRQDITVRTNMLDMRLVAGDPEFFAQARSELARDLLHTRNRAFVDAKLNEMATRRKRFGDTAYALEPNLKEGPGGLRDLQTVYWIGKTAFRVDRFADLFRLGVIDEPEARVLESGHATLMRLRLLLHLMAGKTQDRLLFSFQDPIAQQLGLVDATSELKGERLMRMYYEVTRETALAVDATAEDCLDRLQTTSRTFWFHRKRSLGDGFYLYRDQIHGTPQRLRDRPHLMLHAFRLAQTAGRPLSFEIKKELKRHAHVLQTMSDDEAARAARVFSEILVDPRRLFDVLLEMNALGVLRAYLPAFEHQYCRVQHDTYHTYTADVHLLMCVRAFADLRSGALAETEPELTEVAAALDDPLVTSLAVLLHDIGKGYGGDHSEVGATLCEPIAARLGLDEQQTKTLVALVRHHLLMSHTAQRRDLSDSAVIAEFAVKLDSVAALQSLLVLTYCDQMGVGPGVWTPWKRTLLLKLYEDARRVHEREDIQDMYRDRIRNAKSTMRGALAFEFDTAILDFVLEEMPPRFFLLHDVAGARAVVAALREAQRKGAALELLQVAGAGTYVVLAESDRPGLFAFHAGLFRSVGMSIRDAEGYVLHPSGWVVNLFLVESADPLFFSQSDRIASFTQRLLRHMSERSPEIMAQIAATAGGDEHRPRSRRRVRVRVDRSLSAQFTVFEVLCWDRVGLLQDLAAVFFRHQCTIGVARIHTEGQRVSDTFYVQDTQGRPLKNDDHVESIRADLLHAAQG